MGNLFKIVILVKFGNGYRFQWCRVGCFLFEDLFIIRVKFWGDRYFSLF